MYSTHNQNGEKIMLNEDESKRPEPKFVVVKIDETGHWRRDIQERAGKIHGVYMYNEKERTFCQEVTASYECHFIGSVVENLSDDDIERTKLLDDIDAGDVYSNDINYYHCHFIDSITDKTLKQNVHTDWKPDKDQYATEKDYRELFDEVMADERGNPTFS